MAITLLAVYYASKSIIGNVERQIFLRKQVNALMAAQTQAQSVNKELREGLCNYRSSGGIERLARERLNLVGPNEMLVRISK